MDLTNSLVLGSGGFWSSFGSQVQDWAQNGAAGPGLTALAWVMIAVGILGAGISIIAKKFNPQSRIPGWGGFLVLAFLGVVLLEGPDKIVQLFKNIRDKIYEWLGV